MLLHREPTLQFTLQSRDHARSASPTGTQQRRGMENICQRAHMNRITLCPQPVPNPVTSCTTSYLSRDQPRYTAVMQRSDSIGQACTHTRRYSLWCQTSSCISIQSCLRILLFIMTTSPASQPQRPNAHHLLEPQWRRVEPPLLSRSCPYPEEADGRP